MKIPKFSYKVSPAQIVPKGYGVAYRLWNQDVMIVLPIPINLIVRWSITIYYGLVKAWYPTRWDKKLDEAWSYGLEIGKSSRQHEIELLKIECNLYKNFIKEHIK